MKNNPVYVTILVLLLVCLFFLKLPEMLDPRPPLHQEHNLSIYEQPIDIGDITLQDISKQPHSIAEFSGSYHLIMVWGTWCSVCQRELPKIKQFFNQHPTISFLPLAEPDDNFSTLQQLQSKAFSTHVPLYKLDNHQLFNLLSIAGVPSYYILNPEGKITATLRPNWKKKNLAQLLHNL